ncbi:MAG: TRAP transporter small permease [Desulfobacterota bacterium]|nr:TRAP transporter small permease [Thermodesulfobacteriota bacterium]
MEKVFDRLCKGLEYIMALLLALMVILVFGNVVLRYGFRSGIVISEELSRWLFVWMTFLGAVVGLNYGAHLGTEVLVKRLKGTVRKVVLSVAYLSMLFVCGLVFSGAWVQSKINLTTTSAAMEAPVAIFYASGVVFAILAGLILVRDLVRLWMGKEAPQTLQTSQEP